MNNSGSAQLTPSSKSLQHICVCICTYKRRELLERLLAGLAKQETDGLFTFSIVVADNDRLESARSVASEFETESSIPVTYCVQAEQNIALTRNKAIENSRGDFIAFIDDDQFPTDRWLVTLFETFKNNDVDGVLGPVKPHFDSKPPSWVVRGGFYDRPTYPTGFVIDGKRGRTGNVLLKMQLFEDGQPPFRPQFRTGEDQDFFGRMIEKGHKFIWCNEAVAYEVVPPMRWKRSFMLRRALLRGTIARVDPNFGAKEIAKSAIAVPAYALGLPFALILGQDKFMTLLVKLCDHAGKLLSLVGINPIKESYVTE